MKRRTAVAKIDSLSDATKDEIEKHNDVCAICYQVRYFKRKNCVMKDLSGNGGCQIYQVQAHVPCNLPEEVALHAGLSSL